MQSNGVSSHIVKILIIFMIVILTCGCTGVFQIPPHAGTFTINKIESNEGSHWVCVGDGPTGYSRYDYTLSVSSDKGDETVYATQYFMNRHSKGVPFSDSTVIIATYNDDKLPVFSTDTPDGTRAAHPEVQSPDGCPVGYNNDNIPWIAYVTNYHDIPNTGAHYWQFFEPGGANESNYLTTDKLINLINQSSKKYRTDCLYVGTRTHDYWENDAGPFIQYDAINTTTAIEKIRTDPVNFAISPTPTPASTRTPLPKDAPAGYGCPGCPANFVDFAKDMCSRDGGKYLTVTDGNNTLQCSQINGGKS